MAFVHHKTEALSVGHIAGIILGRADGIGRGRGHRVTVQRTRQRAPSQHTDGDDAHALRASDVNGLAVIFVGEVALHHSARAGVEQIVAALDAVQFARFDGGQNRCRFAQAGETPEANFARVAQTGESLGHFEQIVHGPVIFAGAAGQVHPVVELD